MPTKIRTRTKGRGRGTKYPIGISDTMTGYSDEIVKPVGKIIPDDPDIVDFEYSGSVYVEDGDGSRYTVKYADGSTAEVEFEDRLDVDTYGEEEAEGEGQELRTVSVIWDGAVDFEESYDNNDDASIADLRKSLIERYGKIASHWL